ncbi:MAG: hypothetical protein HUU41_00200 [Bryobacteraceae bacterium]|nr:hypothetical protein [Bryobacterales bacterium]MEB2363359.1 hypothetical protein [Bryobacterales bacterium]NUM99505.1 hypothetical protein [Bryobacteraceae bacterium]
MKRTFIVCVILLVGLLPFRPAVSQQQQSKVKPAKLEFLQNMGVNRSESGRPAFLPREWGRLVSVQQIEGDRYVLFLQGDDGAIYLVRLLQQGQYLYLDTYDQGGVALVIRRER